MAGISVKDLPQLSEELSNAFKIRTMVVTMEEMGAFLFDSEEGKHYLPGYAIDLEDPLGAGDAFAAAFIHHMLKGESLKEACRLGNMLGAAVATTEGATQPLDPSFVLEVSDSRKINIREDLKDFLPDS